MAGYLSTYGANAILDGTAMPTTLYAQLHTGNPSAAGTANVATENSRKATDRDAAVAGATQNDAVIQWFNAAATENISHLTLWDDPDPGEGNCWWVIPRTGGALSVTATDTITIDDGDLDLVFEVWS